MPRQKTAHETIETEPEPGVLDYEKLRPYEEVVPAEHTFIKPNRASAVFDHAVDAPQLHASDGSLFSDAEVAELASFDWRSREARRFHNWYKSEELPRIQNKQRKSAILFLGKVIGNSRERASARKR